MVNIILICFKRNNKNLKKFDKKLNDEKIDFQKETNDDWYNYRFNNKKINFIAKNRCKKFENKMFSYTQNLHADIYKNIIKIK